MKLVPLSRGLSALVDDEDFEVVARWKWYAIENRSNGVFYAARQQRGADGKQHTIRMHRFLLGASDEIEVDHENRDTLNNCRYNLRIATREQNMHNQGMRRTNTSGFTGVTYSKGRPKSKPWMACIRIHGKTKTLGRYETKEEAAKIYRETARLLRGEFCPL